MGQQTTIRFSADVYRRLQQTADAIGVPINSLVVMAAVEWMDAHPVEETAPTTSGRRLRLPWGGRAGPRAQPVACSFCDRGRTEVRRLITGPGISICDMCVALGVRTLAEGSETSNERTTFDVRADATARCAFCGQRGRTVERGEARICGRCLALCTEVIAEHPGKVRC